MTRSRLIVLNVLCWVFGILILWLGNLLLVRLVPAGVVRSVLYFLLLGLVVTIFGGSYGLLRTKSTSANRSGL